MKKNNKQEKQEKKSLLDNRNVCALLSLAIALVIWTYVTTVKDPNQTVYRQNVPVDFSYASEIYRAKDLDIVSNPEAKVSVRLNGSGADVNRIDADDLIVYPDYTAVSGPGEMKLSLQVRFADSRRGRDIEAMTGDTVTVMFDSVEEKTFEIQPVLDTDKISTAEGYVLNSVTAAPGKITVQGPKSEIDRIDRIVAVVKAGGLDMESSLADLTDSKLATAALEAWDKNDKPVELKYTTMDNTMADVSINVYQKKELPLSINFINASPNLDLSTLEYELSQETMEVTGKPSVVSGLTELTVSDFDLGNSFEIGKVFQLNVELPKGVSSKDNLGTVTLSFHTEGYMTKAVNVPNIRVINQPNGMKIKPMDLRVNNVTLVGPKEELEKLAPGSVVAVVDASVAQITEGTESLPVQIQIPSSKTIFAVGSYSAECSVGASGGDN